MKSVLITALLGILIPLTACSVKDNYRKTEGAVWATSYHITYNSRQNLDDSIVAIFDQIDRTLSFFNHRSRLSLINAGETDSIDELFEVVFSTALRVNEASHGKYDPTIGPVVTYYGFGKDGKRNEDVNPQVIDSLMRCVGIAQCKIDNHRLHKKTPLTQFDFSSIAKGFACDLVGEMLERNGCEDYMVEIGGEMALLGKNDRGEDWRVMIDSPIDNNLKVVHKQLKVISPGVDFPEGRCGVATSGNYRNFYILPSGKRINHIIDATTGETAQGETLSATVIAANCTLADALSTACMAMNANEAIEMLKGFEGASALLVVGDKIMTCGKLFEPLATPDHH